MKSEKTSFGSLNRGDLLEIVLEEKELHGEFIEYDKESGILVIKLKSGYDLALPSSHLKDFRVIQKGREKSEKATLESDKGYGDITLITTGGTISSKIDYETGGVSPSVPPEYYFQLAPDIKKYGNVAIKSLMKILSENMQPSDWIKIANEAHTAIEKGSKGVIVTMGTDTMHFAASAISFMLNPLSVPVVFTGSQRSPDRGSSDAGTNLLMSTATAAKWDGGESVICMHATSNDDYNFILRGNKARKMHTERRDAFRPINSLPLAKVYPDGRIEKTSEYRGKADSTKINTKLDDNVKLLVSYPSIGGDIIDYYLKNRVSGFVIAGTGFGNLPLDDKTVYSALKKADKENVPVVITPQTVYGATNRFVYSTLRELSKLKNVIYVGDMTTETAFIKLMFALGQSKKIDEIRSIMTTNLAGELSERNEFESFLV